MINIQNADDNECVKFCLVRYLNPADHNPRRSMKLDKYFVKRLDFKDISNQKLEIFTKLKKRIPLTVVFLVIISIDSCMIIHYIAEETILSLLFI